MNNETIATFKIVNSLQVVVETGITGTKWLKQSIKILIHRLQKATTIIVSQPF